jgi:hypothetical protein
MMLASDQDAARAYATIVEKISGEKPVVVLSDDPKASDKIDEFARGKQRWIVAVRMVSEGVDIPRLAVGVWSTSYRTPLFFAQAVGRFVRARRRGETASVFLPSVPNLLGFASEMEVARDHVLKRKVNDDGDIFAAEDELMAQANAAEAASAEELGTFEAMGSEARFDRVLYDGGEFGHAGEVHVGSDEEMDFLGIPGLLEPDQVRTLLHRRQADRLADQKRGGRPGAAPGRHAGSAGSPDAHRHADESTHQRVDALRRELNGLVGAWNHRTGRPHGVIHNELRRSTGGPPAAQASAEELRTRIDLIREWATRPHQ